LIQGKLHEKLLVLDDHGIPHREHLRFLLATMA